MRLYGNSGSLTIPIYILFDGEGELLEKHAARPSDINKLKMHLEKNRQAVSLLPKIDKYLQFWLCFSNNLSIK